MMRIAAAIRRYPIAAFFGLAFGFSWFCLVLAYGVLEQNLVLAWIGMFGPALAALVVSAAQGGRAALEALLKRLFAWRVHGFWYLVTLGLPPALVVMTVLLNGWLYGPGNPPGSPGLGEWFGRVVPGYAPLLMGMIGMFTVVIMGEEIGWRGFAQPALQARYGALRASLLVGFGWGVWHIPGALDPGNVLHKAPLYLSIPLFVLGTMMFSLVYTWIGHHTGGSLLLMCLFHGAYDMWNSFASLYYPFIITRFWLYLLGLLVVIGAVVLFDPLFRRRERGAATAVEEAGGSQALSV